MSDETEKWGNCSVIAKPTDSELLAEAVKVIEFYAYCQGVDGAIGHRARDFLAKLGR